MRALLTAAGVAFSEKHHEPTFTSEESAQARGEPLQIGAKALVVKVDDRFALFVLPADRKLDSRPSNVTWRPKNCASPTRPSCWLSRGWCRAACRPLAGRCSPLDLFADPALCDNEKIAFNAGSLTTSIVMPSADYRRLAGAEWFAFSQPR